MNEAPDKGTRRFLTKYIVVYRCALLLAIGLFLYKYSILVSIIWPLILLGIAGYIYFLIQGEKPPRNPANYKIIFFFEIWMFFWNGFKWKSYTKMSSHDEEHRGDK